MLSLQVSSLEHFIICDKFIKSHRYVAVHVYTRIEKARTQAYELPYRANNKKDSRHSKIPAVS